jgi:hypothetical protein
MKAKARSKAWVMFRTPEVVFTLDQYIGVFGTLTSQIHRSHHTASLKEFLVFSERPRLRKEGDSWDFLKA